MTEGLELETLSTETQDPTAISVTPDGRVVFSERQGAIKVITTAGTTIEAARLLSAATACVGCPDQVLEEGGIHGLEVSPDFATSHRIYVYYSVPFSMGISGYAADEGLFRLSTFVLRDDNSIDPTSENVILENPAQWLNCCHYGGDIDFMADGTLLLSVGDDTSPREEGWNPRDKRVGRAAFNAERTSQNPLDRRGKVLRMMPDGSVPDGSQPGVTPNPHVGDSKFDPYVYAMGFRSNYRLAVDQATGFTFVGNVGPDAGADDPLRGPKGYDELETIPPGGGTNHGWPRCIGNNLPYVDWNYETSTGNGLLSCDGMTPADVFYAYDQSGTWPVLGNGSRTAIAGVVYRYDGDGPRRLPDAYQGKLLFMEWSRDRVWTIPIEADPESPDYGRLDTTSLTQIASGLISPIDAAVGPDGAVYVAEYGLTFYMNPDSRISRIVPSSSTPPQPAGRRSASKERSLAQDMVVLSGALTAGLTGFRRRKRVPA